MDRKKIIRALVFLVLGIALTLYVFRDTDFDFLRKEIGNITWYWIIFSVLINLGSQWLRALRWKLLFRAAGYAPRTVDLFLSYIILIFSNQVVPRSGEIVRLGIVSKNEGIPMAKVLGTALAERMSDLLVMILIFLVLLGLKYPAIHNLLKLPDLRISSFDIHLIVLVGAGIILLLLSAWFLIFRTRRLRTFREKILHFFSQVREGLRTVLQSKGKLYFIFLTLGIYTAWFMMQYVLFFAFTPTKELGIGVAVLTFGLAAFAFLLPVQAGIGAWHFVVIECLLMYGIHRQTGQAFSLIAHASITLVYYMLGGIAFMLLPLFSRRKSKAIVH